MIYKKSFFKENLNKIQNAGRTRQFLSIGLNRNSIREKSN